MTTVAVAYADCGSYGAIDEVVDEHGIPRLAGDHCYDVFARDEVRAALQEEPGTYFLTDFLARTFEHTVVRELGLDRHPELRDEYFRNYTRVLWLAQRPTNGDARGRTAGGRADRPPAARARGGQPGAGASARGAGHEAGTSWSGEFHADTLTTGAAP